MDYKKFKILIVDDIEEVLESTKNNIETLEAQAYTENNPEKALEFLKNNKVDLILLDYFMPEMSGEQFVNKFREFDKNTVIYLHTGYSDEIPSDEMMENLNIQGYINKAKPIDEIMLSIKSALKTVGLLNQIDTLKYKKGFIGNCLDEVADQLHDKLMGTSTWVSEIDKINSDDGVKENIAKAQESIAGANEVIHAICFNSPKSRTLAEIFDFVKVLNKYKIGKVGMDLCYNSNKNVTFTYYNNSSLVYLLSEVVLYIIENAGESEGIAVKKVNIDTEMLDDKLNIIVDSEFGYEYQKSFIDKLNSIILEEPDGFIDVSVNDNKLIIGFNDVQEGIDNSVIVGANQN